MPDLMQVSRDPQSNHVLVVVRLRKRLGFAEELLQPRQCSEDQ